MARVQPLIHSFCLSNNLITRGKREKERNEELRGYKAGIELEGILMDVVSGGAEANR